MAMGGKIKEKPNLSLIALISFVTSFAIARIFTALNPNFVLVSGNYHIHHFWYGIALLAIGGWLGINYQSERTDRLAAILFGAGGGLIGDEIGLLLTFDAQAYWAGVTYTFIVVFVVIASASILVCKYRKTIHVEFSQFLRNNASLYVGVFLIAVSASFILETDNILVIIISSVSTAVAFVIILSYFIHRMKRKRHKV
jgi:hypothetical protein